MNVYLPNLRLPSAYQEVEYIQSSGTQYIDTGIKFTNNTTSDFDIAFTTNRSGWSGIIGAQYQNVNTSRAIGISETNFTYQQGSVFGDWTETPTLNQKYNFTNDATNVYVDGVVKKNISSGGTFTTPVNGTIFKVNYSSSTGFPYLVSAKLYKCKLYESGTLVRDFVPCYRKQDSVIGLYDLVNSVFYTNAGTGTFSKGNDVTMSEVQNIYIGEYVNLMSYSEIVAMATAEGNPWTNTIAELNSNAQLYYDKLNTEGHLLDKTVSGLGSVKAIDGIIYYNSSIGRNRMIISNPYNSNKFEAAYVTS